MSQKPLTSKRKSPKARTKAIPLRMSEREILLIEMAAQIVGKNRTDFIRSYITTKAEEIIAAQGGISTTVGESLCKVGFQRRS